MIAEKSVGPVWLLVLSLMLFGGSHAASARDWRPPKPEAAAIKYTQILDHRSPREHVMVWWIAPENLGASQGAEPARKVLREYLVVGVVHQDMSEMGTPSFRPISGVQIKTAEGTIVKPLAEADVPPAAAGLVAVIRNMYTQILGPLGQGMHWLTFKNNGIDSCKSGRFWVLYAGEQYDYETPIPGCE